MKTIASPDQTFRANGKYLITDPCYVIPDDHWHDFLEPYWALNDGVLEVDGHRMWVGPTNYGDGSYPVFKKGVEVGGFGVDAGMYAIIPLSFLEASKRSLGDVVHLGVIVDLNGTVEFDGEGDLTVGDVLVTTGGSLTEKEDEGYGDDDFDDDPYDDRDRDTGFERDIDDKPID